MLRKETQAWFQARGIVVPLGGKRFGFICTIANEEENVKFSMRDTDENVQSALTAEAKAFAQVNGHGITALAAETSRWQERRLTDCWI